jgi:hypothetical protein
MFGPVTFKAKANFASRLPTKQYHKRHHRDADKYTSEAYSREHHIEGRDGCYRTCNRHDPEQRWIQ